MTGANRPFGDPEARPVRGTVVSFDRRRGYGFVTVPDAGGTHAILHRSQVEGDASVISKLRKGAVVEFTPVYRIRATRARIVGSAE
jgi:cold shock CspA family protein